MHPSESNRINQNPTAVPCWARLFFAGLYVMAVTRPSSSVPCLSRPFGFFHRFASIDDDCFNTSRRPLIHDELLQRLVTNCGPGFQLVSQPNRHVSNNHCTLVYTHATIIQKNPNIVYSPGTFIYYSSVIFRAQKSPTVQRTTGHPPTMGRVVISQ